MKSLKVRTEKISLGLRMANYVGVLMVVAAMGFSAANAASVSPFFDAGFECQNTLVPASCASEPASIWHTGDFFGENFTSTGLATVFQLSLDTFTNNALDVTQTEVFNVSVNGSVVGSVSVPGAGVGAGTPQTLTQAFSFGAISGPNYDVRFTVTSPTIGVGLGSIGFIHDGTSSSVTLTEAPEPGTMLLLGGGLLGLVIRRMRKA
jgi:PEP-CTERM motif